MWNIVELSSHSRGVFLKSRKSRYPPKVGTTQHRATPEHGADGGRPSPALLNMSPEVHVRSVLVDVWELVGGLEHVLFSHILGIITPID